MTVENWLRGHFQDYGSLIEKDVLGVAALSPISATPTPFRILSLNDDVETLINDSEAMHSLNYALSTLYYSMSAATGGGSKSEKRGNRQISIGGKAIDVATREAWRKEGDRLRRLLGSDIDERATTDGGLFDASDRITRYPNWRR